MEDSYLWTAGIKQLEMRLIVEGAIALYEDEAVPLLGLAIKNEKYEAADAFDALGDGTVQHAASYLRFADGTPKRSNESDRC